MIPLNKPCEVCRKNIGDGGYFGTGPMKGAVRYYHFRCAPPLVPIEVSGEVNRTDNLAGATKTS